MRIFKLFMVTVVAIALASCEPTFKKEYSWAYPIAGDWLITIYDKADGSQQSDPFEMRAYNTSFGTDSVWFDDYASGATAGNHPWLQGLKFKVAANMAAKTFQTTNFVNALSAYGPVGAPKGEMNLTVENGKIVGVDSIYMEVQLSDDPGITYIYSGHRETSYEDYMGQH